MVLKPVSNTVDGDLRNRTMVSQFLRISEVSADFIAMCYSFTKGKILIV